MTELSPPTRDRRPLPVQLGERIREYIRDESLCPGDQLPAEPALAELFMVGRSTLREAMKLLERDGLIEVRHGRGSFVAAIAELGADRPITRFESVTEMLRGLEYEVRNVVVSVTERAATEAECAELQLPADATVVELARLRCNGEEPLVYSVNVFARELLDRPIDEVDWSGSLLDLLADLGYRVVSSAAHIRAVGDLPALPAVDGVSLPDVSWLLISETCMTETGLIALRSDDFHRGDLFAFHVIRRLPPGSQGGAAEQG